MPPQIQRDHSMQDETEPIRRQRIAELSSQATDIRAALEARHGQVWTTDEVREEFEVIGFLAPLVAVRRKSDGAKGSLEFQASPRYYFNWIAD